MSPSRLLLPALLGWAAVAPPSAPAADWKPAPSPLLTRWGKQVTADTPPWPEYPRPQLVRKDWQNLNGLWDYAITPKGAATPTQWDGKILVPFCVESALSGVGKAVSKEQNLWYHREIAIPDAWDGKRLLLHFGAVDWEATVFVNGKELTTHRGGSDPFSVDVTDALKEKKGDLVIRVWDPTDAGSQPRGKQVRRPESIWYTAVTGIWQTVWLEPVSNIGSITSLQVSTDIDTGAVTVGVTMDRPRPDAAAIVEVRDGAAVVATGGGSGTSHTLKVPNPKLWSPDAPNLYTLRVTTGSDAVESYFAMRKISTGPDDKGVRRILLNNKPLFQVGPLDQGWWPDGLLTPPSDEAMRYDLDVLKQLGLNMLRKHIKVEPARLYYHCDKIGLMVWQDMPSGGGTGRNQFISPDAKEDAGFTPAEKTQFRTELKAIIDHLRVFPCIVTWVPFNEGWGQHDTNEVLKWVKSYDPTRLVDGPSGWADRGYGDLHDMHHYPHPNMFPTQPDRVSVLGEFGGLGLPIKGHLWKGTDNWGYQSYDNREALRRDYRRLMLRLHPLIGKGLSAAVYTQTTDVEVEVNGFMTYDREVLKLDPVETAKWHKALFGPPPVVTDLVPTSERAAQRWKYTTTKPAAGWEQPAFEAGWAEGDGGLGTRGTPGTVVRTTWDTPDVWARRPFELAAVPVGEVFLRLYHDEDAEVYLNGVLAAKGVKHNGTYEEVPISSAARNALKPARMSWRCIATRRSAGNTSTPGWWRW